MAPPCPHLIRVAPRPELNHPALSPARAELWIPRPSLASCVRAVMSRDTRGVALLPAQRLNHFPATPACTLVWYFEGQGIVHSPGVSGELASRADGVPVTLVGPLSHPSVTANPGPIHAMMLQLMPDALKLLTGIDPNTYRDAMVPATTVFDASWRQLFRSVVEAHDDTQRVARIAAFVQPLWKDARPKTSLFSSVVADWTRSLALRAIATGGGRSQRQVERRIKLWTAQTLRELRGLGRVEEAFFDAAAAARSGAINWSEGAANCGYADQSHLCRQVRRVTGFAPEELRQRVVAEESFWAYRLWGFTERLAAD